MPTTFVKRDTTTLAGGAIQHDLLQTTNTDATLNYSCPKLVTTIHIWGSDSLNTLDWTGGDHTWRFRVKTANSLLAITQVRLIRYASDGSTEIAAKSSGTISVSCGTTGVKSGTISWNDGTQNPAGRSATDRYAIEITIGNTSMTNTSIDVGTNLSTGNDEISTPLTLSILNNRSISEDSVSVSEELDPTFYLTTNISEPSVSVSESLDDTETYIKPISETPSVDISDAVEGTFQVGSNLYERTISDEPPVSVSDELDDTEIYTKPINEDSVSVSESIDDVETYQKPISSESPISVNDTIDTSELYDKPVSETSVSVSDSIEGTKIPEAPTAELYDVHFVEFPEEIFDSLYVPPTTQVTQVSTTKTHIYGILSPVSTTKTHLWNVVEKVTATKTHLYGLLNSVSTTKTHLWNVVHRVGIDTSHLFHIISKVLASKTHLYGIAGQVTASKTHRYNISGVVTQVSTTKTHLWNIYERILVEAKTHLYNLLERIAPSKTHKYDVESKVTTTKTHPYDVIERVTVLSRTHKWNILNRVSPDATRTHIYSILEKVTSSPKTHLWNTIATIIRTHIHRWNAGGKVVVTKTHNYNIGLAYAPPEGGGSSTVVRIGFPERIRIVDIISDIRNLAIANIEVITARPPREIICVGVVELNEAIISPIIKVASGKARHRIASTLIIPQILDTIEHLAVSDRIALELLPLQDIPQFQLKSEIQLSQPSPLYLQSHTQIKEDPTKLIRLSSTTELIPRERIASMAKLELSVLNNIQLKAPEIMTSEKYKILKRLIDILSNNKLFESGDILLKSPDRIIDPVHEQPSIYKKIMDYLGHDNLFESG